MEVMYIVLEDKRTETPFAARDNMLDIWRKTTELGFRGFGRKNRKNPKEPRNFSKWSEESKRKWHVNVEKQLAWAEKCDEAFIINEFRVVDNLCREIVYVIDKANTINPQYLCECDQQRLLQDEAIGRCSNLIRELNHIADTIPCNKNFLVLLVEDIEKEIAILRGWRKSCNATINTVIEKEIRRQKSVENKL